MMKCLKLLGVLLGIYSLNACANISPRFATMPIEDQPTPPSGELAKPTRLPPLLGVSGGMTRSSGSSRTLPMVSIMSYTSGIITVWATAANNWLWGYSPFDSKDFGNLRNWYLLRNANGSVSFKNVQTGTCMASYKTGIIHTACDRNQLAQQFDLVLLTNGAVLLKSAENQQCLYTPLFRSTTYMSLMFARCAQEGQMTTDQQWFITPPIVAPLPIPPRG